MATVTLQVIARCQRWARLVPWWQPMKLPWWCDRLRDQNYLAFCETYRKWKRAMGFTFWCCLLPEFNFAFVSNFWLASSLWKLLFSIRLGPLRWVPTALCAGRRGLNLLTAVRPVELAQWKNPEKHRWMDLVDPKRKGISKVNHCVNMYYYSTATWSSQRLIPPTTPLSIHPFVQPYIKRFRVTALFRESHRWPTEEGGRHFGGKIWILLLSCEDCFIGIQLSP